MKHDHNIAPAEKHLNILSLTNYSLSMLYRTGTHLEAMKQSARIAFEIWIYTYNTDKVPDWSKTKKLLTEKGKAIKFK